MDYMIRNKRGQHIRLDKHGQAITCAAHDRGIFEYSKAKNILNCLPKSLKKFNFEVVAIPDIMPAENRKVVSIIKNDIINHDGYELSESVARWVEKFGECADVLYEAKQELNSLAATLKETDDELLDILHSIELERSKDLFGGWKIYKQIRENRKKRRIVKDEILIIENVLTKIDPSYLDREKVQKAIDGLFKRKYRFRIVETKEEEESEGVV